MKTDTSTDQNKKPAILLWLVCHITCVVFPLALVISMLLTHFGMAEGALTLFLSTVIAFQIISMYSTLDYEVTRWVLEKKDDD